MGYQHRQFGLCVGARIMKFLSSSITLLFVLFLMPSSGFCEGVIGLDSVFGVNTMAVLQTGSPYDQVFNYFFTMISFFGMVSVFIKLLIRVIKKAY